MLQWALGMHHMVTAKEGTVYGNTITSTPRSSLGNSQFFGRDECVRAVLGRAEEKQ
jgi:hypothetical protein